MKELEAELAMVRPHPLTHPGLVGHLPEVMSWLGDRECTWAHLGVQSGVRRGGAEAGAGPGRGLG